MKIQRWDGAKLVDVQDQDLPTYARTGFYIPCSTGDCRHAWVFANPDAPVPTSDQIKQAIKNEVPHM